MSNNKENKDFDVFTGKESSRKQQVSSDETSSLPNHDVFSEQSYKVARAKIVESEYVRKQD